MSQTATIVAKVYLVTASGKSLLDPSVTITTDNIDQYRPAPTTVAEASRLLEALGFEVLFKGLTLTIKGPLSLFEEVFQVTFDTSGASPRPTGEAEIPPSLQHVIEAISFRAPARLYG